MSAITALTFLGLIMLMQVGIEIMFTYATKGFGFGFSSNRPEVAYSPLAQRMKKALQNQTEAAAYLVPLLAAAAFAGLEGSGFEIAALLIVIGRAAFAPLYWIGTTFIRVPAFVMASFSALYVVYLLLTAPMG